MLYQLHVCILLYILTFFFFNDTATTEIYTLSLHDALPIWVRPLSARYSGASSKSRPISSSTASSISRNSSWRRSEEHTSELQSRRDLVCRLLLEKKKTHVTYLFINTVVLVDE